MMCVRAEINIQILREKTEYRGNVSARDKHVITFWEMLESFNQKQREMFLQFVWGRNRLPNSTLGFGRDTFKISDHAAALSTGNHNNFLPVAHTWYVICAK